MVGFAPDRKCNTITDIIPVQKRLSNINISLKEKKNVLTKYYYSLKYYTSITTELQSD